jgi:hypothetical protein
MLRLLLLLLVVAVVRLLTDVALAVEPTPSA